MQINWLTLFTFTAILYHNDEDFFPQQGDLHIVDSFKDIESERVSWKCHLKPALVTTISLPNKYGTRLILLLMEFPHVIWAACSFMF